MKRNLFQELSEGLDAIAKQRVKDPSELSLEAPEGEIVSQSSTPSKSVTHSDTPSEPGGQGMLEG
jgi:beta-lactam-binding protein with PASTA domain